MEQSYIYKLLYSELQTELTFAIFEHRRTAPLVFDSKPLRQILLPNSLLPPARSPFSDSRLIRQTDNQPSATATAKRRSSNCFRLQMDSCALIFGSFIPLIFLFLLASCRSLALPQRVSTHTTQTPSTRRSHPQPPSASRRPPPKPLAWRTSERCAAAFAST